LIENIIPVEKRERRIFHVDLDAFFAAVEERENPAIRGKPVVVGADPKEGKGRGVVSTCNYEARKFGIRSGMPISRAWKLCPQAIYLPVNMPLYEKVSEKIMKILRKFADKFEQVGIDEAFLDVSKTARTFDSAARLAKKIKEEVKRKEKLTCSIGVAPNKLVAKIASDFRKPDGLTIITPEKVRSFLSPLPVRKLPGVGPKTESRLRQIGIETIGQLAKADPEDLAREFGVWGPRFVVMANGIDESEVEERYVAKSFGRQHTFEKDTDDVELMHKTIEVLSNETFEDVKRYAAFFKTVTLILRYENFETHTRSKTLESPAMSAEVIKKTAKELLKDFLGTEKKVRLIGVRVSGLLMDHRQKKLLESVKK